MSMYQLIAQRSIPVADLAAKGGPTAGVYSGSGGTFVVELAQDPDGKQTTFTAVPAGTWLPISVKLVASGPVDAVYVAV